MNCFDCPYFGNDCDGDEMFCLEDYDLPTNDWVDSDRDIDPDMGAH